MKKRVVSLISPLLGLLLLASLASCNGGADPQPTTSPTGPSQDVGSLALPAGAMRVVNEFTDQHQAINGEWDQFHQDFDNWRTGLTSCERSAVHASLQGFASDFNDVIELAMELPRSASTRDMADTLIEAAEAEGRAFRQLRDRWQPGNTTLFELVEQQRSDSARAQRGVEDSLAELRDSLESDSGPDQEEALQEFSAALDALILDWDSFHDDFAILRQAADGMTASQVLDQLQGLLAQLSSIADAINRLPSSGATSGMIANLQEAANVEGRTLLSIRNGLSEASAPPSSGSLEGATPELPPTPASGPRPGLFLDAMLPAIERAEALLEQVSGNIAMLMGIDPESTLAEIDDFDSHYQDLLVQWDAFHDGYNDWRRTDGGCDQTGVLQALDRFNLRMGDLGRQVRDLPQSSYLQPIHTLLVEALAREEGSIRALRNTWRPFTVDAFKAVDQERLNADRLRRQADIALQELRDRS